MKLRAKDINEIIGAIKFSPKDKELQIIADANNGQYFRLRAIELLRGIDTSEATSQSRADAIIKAQRLLVLAGIFELYDV